MFDSTLYRKGISPKGMTCFVVRIKETDLFVCALRNLEKKTKDLIIHYRNQIETYIRHRPEFRESLVPIGEDEFAPPIIKEMIWASKKVGVGPMASVAGAIAEYVGRDLLTFTKEVIIENGGDIFINVRHEIKVALFAGNSPFSKKIAIKIKPEMTPLGICTSSGTVGHSLSFGKTDAVSIISTSCSLADAAATAVGNLVKTKKDISKALNTAMNIPEIKGTIIIVEDNIGVCGELELIALN